VALTRRHPRLWGSAFGALGRDGGERQADEVGAAGVLGPAASLGRVERAVWVDLALEPREESCAGYRGRLARLAPGVQGVGGQPCA
jgi:hypothetical protein